MFQSTSETVNILYKQIQLYKHKYIYILLYIDFTMLKNQRPLLPLKTASETGPQMSPETPQKRRPRIPASNAR